jgi:hypothetical protein
MGELEQKVDQYAGRASSATGSTGSTGSMGDSSSTGGYPRA